MELDPHSQILLEEALERGLFDDEASGPSYIPLYDFAYSLGYKDITEFTHGPICKVLESESLRKLIIVPRGCFKSSLCTVSYPIWKLRQNPNLRILIDSELYGNSVRFLHEIKEHLASENFISKYGDWRSKNRWKESEILLSTRTKIYKEGSITCSGVGSQKTSQHYDIIISDDLSSPRNITTREYRDKVISHFRLYSSLLVKGGEIVVVGTRYHEQDIAGHVLKISQEEQKGFL